MNCRVHGVRWRRGGTMAAGFGCRRVTAAFTSRAPLVMVAFCGFEGANYSERRLRYFRALAAEAGLS